MGKGSFHSPLNGIFDSKQSSIFLHRTLSRVWHACGKSKRRTVCRILYIINTPGIMKWDTPPTHTL